MPARSRIAAPAAALAQAQSRAAQAVPAQDPGARGLPRMVLPVAAIGLVLLLGGLALWRRPHAGR